jgi:glycerophosphoryl diester phosphodiesterase
MNRPLLLGHRGARASRHTPENTLASFELCLQHGCDGFEFDVRRSADGEAVICHDAAAGGNSIENTPAKSLALPTLEEVLQQFSCRAFLDIELKVAGLEQQTITALRKYPPQRGFVVSSFLPEVLRAVHDLDASVPLGFLCESRHQLVMERRASSPVGQRAALPGVAPGSPSQLPVTWMIPRLDLVDQALVKQFHATRKKVMVWTVNRAENMRQLSEWGVDGIISDETELAVRPIS